MDWPILLIIILAVFLFIKVVSKVIRILLGLVLLGAIFYFFSSLDFAMIMF